MFIMVINEIDISFDIISTPPPSFFIIEDDDKFVELLLRQILVNLEK